MAGDVRDFAVAMSKTSTARPATTRPFGEHECVRLVSAHPVGGSKAKFFRSLGFRDTKPGEFAEALKEHGRTRPVGGEIPTGYGTKYLPECSMSSPCGTDCCVRAVWIQDMEQPYRLITVYPVHA